jgi:superfamily II DNA or RNA helicase
MGSELWKHQVQGIEQFWAAVADGKRRICITGATGCGKTRIASELIKDALGKEALDRGWNVAFSVNRKSLGEQARQSFEGYGLDPGMRASGYETEFGKPLQVSMTPTESVRALGNNPSWGLHNADLVFFDEAHNEKSARSLKLIEEYQRNNSDVIICGLTATPLDIGHIYDTLIVAGVNSELRECGAHLFCKEFSPTLPDVLKMKRKANGEYAEKDVDKKMQPAMVFGRILEHHRRLNPTLKPAIVFAPSVGHSITIAEMYLNAGIRAAHICGKHIYYGEKNSEGVPVMEDSSKIRNREELFDKVRTGEIQVLSSKYVLVEGIDLPMVYHTIMATIFGSLTMYLQAGGRGLRNHDSLSEIILQDHGANCLMHGSLNDDRVWDLGQSAKKIAEQKTKDRQSGKDKEPIVCPKCGAMRLSGGTCWECGHKHSQSGLNILEEDGTLRQRTGDYIKVRKAKSDSQAIKSWFSTYFPCSKSKSPRAMTWNQMLGQFKHKNPDLIVFKTTDTKGRKRIAATDSSGVMSYLPMHPPVGNEFLWSQKVRDVPRENLVK